MNILFHHRTRGKGAEGVHIMGVTNGLRSLGHCVHILSLPGADPESGSASSGGTQHENTAVPQQKGMLVRWLLDLTRYVPEAVFELFELAYNLPAVLRLRRAVKCHNINTIYERYSLFMFATVWWARRKNIPVIIEINDSCLVHRVRPLFFRALARKIEGWVFRNATGLVFISGHFQQVAKDGYRSIAPSVISPNGADLNQFVIDEQAAKQLREKLNIDDKVVLGYVGAFVHWHGIDWFVDLIADKIKQYPDLVLLLVGDGVSFEPIKQRIEQAGITSQIILTGRVAHQEIATYIGAMDYGILPDSNDYGSPMKLFEFMAMAKGMVIPDFSPVTEVVKDNETGWLFPANDRNACIARVLQLVADKEQQRRVGTNARHYIEQHRQWKHNAEQLLGLLPDA
ncbi:MAG: glycosyltransferase WbuB [Alteromonadaceae bacterium]|jgi:glycosyltransferase involved in cell wall biosynthesis|uniref:glycosyltransferase family 4 protein n=1 Tax=Rheinheimera aquimaris TaxID=412437 RepID=UPI000C4CDE22|nr:glycosyltransferase family 4 protein [Rheinheimera aquimaris]MBJ91437.1 glycosyltransferase WbuB [Alteromonadaceae bacterium]|tara:strand:+ start:917 stop:2113 length:1197 start_codon:yes stop_codon:yes gene_type:complete